jgi:hypothetical protein
MINAPQYVLNIGYNEKCIKELVNTKSLGLQIHNHLNWKNRTDHLILKLSETCCAVGFVSH